MCQGVKWKRIAAKVVEREDGFSVREIEPLEVGVEAGFWGAEVGNSC